MRLLGLRFLLLLALAAAQLGGFARAQSSVVWYYNVDQDVQIAPERLDFYPEGSDLLCATLLEPAAQAGEVQVGDLTPPAGCPAAPPVVVWGVDPATGETVYAALITIKFWGERHYRNRRTGVNPLIDTLKDGYALEIEAAGDLDRVDAQLLPPLTTPPVDAPVTAGGWYRWTSLQTVSLADPEVSEEENHPRNDPICQSLFPDHRCWSALLTWALPVRLVLHGDEQGAAEIVLTPTLLRSKTAETLSVVEGELVRVRVLPAPRR